MRALRSVLRLSVALLACLPTALQAQARGDSARVADLIVTATRVPASTSTVAAATTVLRGDDLRARGIISVTDALREVPGVTLVQGGGYGGVTSIFMRGGESDYVKVLLDGVPLNLPGGSIDLANLTTTDLDRIEVVRGPTSVLYGADAMSGVVQLFTRSGTGQTHGSLVARGGSFGAGDFDGHLSSGAGAFAGSVEASRFRSDGSYQFNSQYRNDVGAARLTWNGGAKGSLAFTARNGNALSHFPTDYAGAAVDRNQFVTERSLALGLVGSRTLGSTLKATVQGVASRNRRGAQNRPDSPADTVGFGFDSDADAVTWRRGLEARLDWRPDATTVLSVGTGFERESIAQQTRTAENFGGGVFVESDSFDVHRTTADAYSQLLLNPTRAVSLQLGGRVDRNSAFGSFATGRAGLSWQAKPTTRLWAATGTAFKAPTFFELFAASAFEVGNPSLGPERSSSVEAGVDQRLLHGRVVIGATLFAQRFRHLIQYVSAAPGEPTYVNLGGARSRGLETTLGTTLSSAISLQVHWTWLSTAVTDSGSASTPTFTQGAALLRRPSRSGGATVTWRNSSAMLSTTVSYLGRRDDVDFRDFPSTRTGLPSYTTIDVALDAPVVRPGRNSPGVDVTLRAENLFDAAFEQTIGFPGRGRTLLGGARVRF